MKVYQIVKSKLAKTKVLQHDEFVAKYIPETVLYDKNNLQKMLTLYRTVFVKPDYGKGGDRVMSLSRMQDGYLVRYDDKSLSGLSFNSAAKTVEQFFRADTFLIQRGINLLSVGNSPIDIRVYVQKPYSTWEVTGFLGKIAAKDKVVTNYKQGGTLHTYEETMEETGINSKKTKELKELISRISLRIAKALNEVYPGLRELGPDIGFDRELRPWLFEVNTRPVFIKGKNPKYDKYHKIILKDVSKNFVVS